MKEQIKITPGSYDTPIPKPPDDVFEKFIRGTEARFVTKRFTRERPSHFQNRSERIEAR